MSEAAGSMSAQPAPDELFDRFIDDAAVFPPGNSPLPEALAAHYAYRDAPLADLVGPFLCPASRLDELAATARTDTPLNLRVIVDTGLGGLAEAVITMTRETGGPPYQPYGFEVALPAGSDLAGAARRVAIVLRDANLPPGETVFIEVPIGPLISARSARAALDVLAENDLYAKLRTGGADASAFPTEQQVAGFIDACLDRELGFKCTAGLHNAVRHTDPVTGFEYHGFLNVILATHVLVSGEPVGNAVSVLAHRDGADLAAAARALSSGQAMRVRRSFRSVGSCSVTEPYADLVALGLVRPATSPSPTSLPK